MAKPSLEHSSLSLNLSLDSHHDSLLDCLSKAHALVYVALSEHFASSGSLIIHDYLSVLEDFILKAKALFEEVWRIVGSQKMREEKTS